MVRYLLYLCCFLVLAIAVFYLVNAEKRDYATDVHTLANGKKLFTSYCSSCHGIEGDGIGPRLGGITRLLSEHELKRFIKNPARFIASGDERALRLQGRYKQAMPAFEWMQDSAIHSILSYIHSQTELFHIDALQVNDESNATNLLKGRLVAPVKKSKLKIELEDFIQIPRLKESSPDLGIVTLRPHPSGDRSLFVSDQSGIIYRIYNGNAEVFLDLRTQIEDFQSGPGIATGLGSFDFHPDYLNNGLIYVTHAETFSGQTADYLISDSVKAEVQWVLSEWKMDDVKNSVFKGERREMLRLHAPTFGHGAQDIGFIPALDKNDLDYGLLYFGFGDGGSNNIRRPELGHHLKSFLGSILRIDPRGTNSRNGKYGIPPDNPFINETDPAVMKEIYAYGFRNPHRMAWDVTNGKRMIVTDIGESNIEEINIVERGGDYGWPDREGNFGIFTRIDLKTVHQLGKGDLSLYKKPFAQYDHEDGFAISGGYLYEGPLEDLKAKYVFGDIVNGKLFYVNIDRPLTDSTIYEIQIIQDGKETDLREMSKAKRLHLRVAYDRFAKELYVITKVDGRIRRVANAY